MTQKVIILSAFLTPFRSGAEACAEEVPLQLSDQFDFTIVTARLRRDLPKTDLLQGKIPVVRVGCGLPIDKWLFPFLAPFAVASLKPDIVHAVLESFAGLALVFCRFTVPKAKRLLTCQTTNRNFLRGCIVRSPDAVTVISTSLKNTAARYGRLDATVIPNGVDLAAMEHARGMHPKVPGRILFVGRIEKMKGVDVLLRAFEGLVVRHKTQDTRAELHIVGDGSLKNTLESCVSKLSSVHFLGYLRNEALHREYAEAEIFCGLSRSEGLGNVFLEAQAAGCAVLATNVGGIPDIVQDNVTGLLISPDDPDAAARALELLLADAPLRARLAEAAKQHAEAFDWNAIAKRYAQVYRALA